MTILQHPDAIVIISKFLRPMPDKIKYRKRLKEELKMIIEMNFVTYILQAIEILNVIKTFNTQWVTRGSAGSSLVIYLLGFSVSDPVIEDISFARFLNSHRKSFPDIDIDVPYNIRTQVFAALHEKIEYEVARISNHVIYKPKSSLREAIRQIGYRKMIKNKDLDSFIRKLTPEEKLKLAKYQRNLLGTFKNYSLHCGGIILFKDKIPEELKLNTKTFNQIKYDKNDVAKLGMLKLDVLSNRGLAVLMEIEPDISIESYDGDDLNIAKSILQSNLGIPLCESRAMNRCNHILSLKNRKDLATSLSIVRPAASMSKSQISDNKNTQENRIESLIIFDDDAIKYIQGVINCDSGIADKYRRAFSKCNQKEIKQFQNIIAEHQNKKSIMENLENLKQYSFCKSHSFSYAYLCWALAYHKYHNPKKYWVAVLNHANSFYATWVHKRQAILVGLDLTATLGNKKPWKLIGDKVVPAFEKITKQKKEQDNKKDSKNADIRSFFNKSIPKNKIPIEDSKPQNDIKKLNSFNNKNNHIIGDPLKEYKIYKYWVGKDFLPGMYITYDGKKIRFRGLIAQGRNIHNRSKAKNKKSSQILFLTIGVNDNLYDLIIEGSRPFWLFDCISGIGTYTIRHDVLSISVEKSRFENL